MYIFSVWLAILGCGGESVVDADNDGFDASVDCDDSDADINSDAAEVCDGLDNNCDDEIDEATATDAGTWYADFDLDSYGDANTSMIACEMPEGYVEDSTDCDDTSELVNPAGAEVCDGIDNDCDANTSEDGMATHTSTDGEASDVTADVSGTDGAPAEFIVSDGELHFCDGTFYVNLMVDGDATVGSFNEDPTQAILDGGGVGRPVFVWGDGLTVGVMDLTLQNGFAPEADGDMGIGTLGGGVHCSTDPTASEFVANDMNLDNLMITGNEAETGGGMFSDGCNLTISNSEISGNTSFMGGGIISLDGNQSLMSVDIVDNESMGYAAGGFASGLDEDSLEAYTVILTDVIVTGNVNTADVGGVLAIVGSTAATWTGTAGAEGSGIWGNTSPGFGALELIDGGQLVADTVDFGSAETGTGNTDFDVSATADLFSADYWVARDDASFSCDEFGCGTPVATVIVDPSQINGAEPLTYGWGLAAPFTVDSTGTLESVDLYSFASDSGCDVEFALLSSDTALVDVGEDPIDWTVEWQSSQALSSTAAEWVNSGTIGKVLDDSMLYAFSWHVSGWEECAMLISFLAPEDESSNTPVSIQGLGVMHPGYFFIEGTQSTVVGDSLSLSYDIDFPFLFDLTFNVTQL
jgi:hypothetical protein